jgi:hypothetical protein
MRALFARVRAISPATVWFPALAVIVAGPLLAFSGYLMLLDYPAGPEFPKFSWFPLPSSGDIGNSTPLLAIERFLRWVHVYLPDKVLLVAPIVLGGIGIYRFTRRHLEVGPWAGLFGGTLYVINPFVLDRYLAGHVHFLLGYGLLPWALVPVARAIDDQSVRRVVPLALWLFVLGIVDLHIMGIYGLLVLVAIAFAKTASVRRIGMAAGTVGLALLLSAFWVLPAIFTTPGQGIGAADLEVYATRPRGYSVLPTLLSMYGFWRDEFVGPAQRIPALYLLLVPILGVVTLGLATLVAPGWLRRFAGALGVSALLALVLAAGISFPPTAGTFRWLFDHVPLLGVYREPQKLLAGVVLAYGMFAAIGLGNVVVRWKSSRVPPALIGAVLLASALTYTYPLLWGFGGQVHLSRYPDSWIQAKQFIEERGPGNVLVFPWHQYAVWTFSDGRIVANPAASFFRRSVLIDKEAGFSSVPLQSPDPFLLYVRQIVQNASRVDWLGHLIGPLDVRYVILLHEVDDWNYQFLDAQTDLRPLLRSAGLEVFENSAWRGGSLEVEGRTRIAGTAELLGSDDERLATQALVESPPLTAASNSAFLSFGRLLPGWERVDATEGGRYLLTPNRCSDGWRLGNAAARCHLGATAAFEAPEGARELWRPLTGANLLAYAVTGLTLSFIGAYLWRDRLRSN